MTGAVDRIGWALRIRTEIDLPGTASPREIARPDIEIRFGAADRWHARREWGPYRVENADLFAVDLPGVAHFTCRDRRDVAVTPVPGATRETIAAMLIATVLPALLWARGEILVHAAAAVAPGARRGRLFVGDSGCGKSTRLMRTIARGARAIGDDSIRLRMAGNRVIASGLPGGAFRNGLGSGDDREFIAFSDAQHCIEHAVGTVIVMSGVGTGRLTGPKAVEAILRHRHRPRIVTLLGTEAALLAPLARIALALNMVSVTPFADISVGEQADV